MRRPEQRADAEARPSSGERVNLFAAHRTFSRYFLTRVSPDHLRRLSEGAQEGTPHSVAISKTRVPSDDIDRMAALLHHQSGCLDAQVLDRFARRLTGLSAERAAELART